MEQCAKEFLRLRERADISRQKEKARGRHEQKENTMSTMIYLAISIGISTWIKIKQNKITSVHPKKEKRRLTDQWNHQ